MRPTRLILSSLVLAGCCLALAAAAIAADPQAYADLKPKADIVYLLANSSIIIGPDVNGRSEDITFTGPVSVPKYPLQGFERRKLPSGRYQIDFELTSSKLRGESYLMNGSVVLGEHPELRSLGTITQREAGHDYPADFIVQRKVMIETPKGTMFNEDPVPVRGVIDAIPPVRQSAGLASEEVNVFHGKELPVAMLDPDGGIAGWFYSKVHVAFAVEPRAIYRVDASGEITLRAGDRQEKVPVRGPVEVVEMTWKDGSVVEEIVKMALRGDSELLGGRIMITEAFRPTSHFSRGHLGDASAFDVYLEIKAPSRNLEVQRPLAVRGTASRGSMIDSVGLTSHAVPVYSLRFDEASRESSFLTDEAGRKVATVVGFRFRAGESAPNETGGGGGD